MINLKCPINFLGYGIIGKNILKSLILDHQQEVCYFPIGNPECEQQYFNIIQQSINNQEKFNTNNPSLICWHEHDLFSRIGKGKNAALSFFELNKFNNRRKKSIENQDIFLVPSQWAKDIVNQELPKMPVEVIEMGVDCNEFKSFTFTSEKPYRFLAVGKIEVRKGYDILHKLFNSAFTQEDDVELYIAWDNPFLSVEETKKWIQLYKETPLGDKIHFITRQPSLLREYITADCFILPTRAEALCLPILEALACSKPIITTNYSGHSHYLSKETAFLVDIDTLESAYDGIWFNGEGEWASLRDKQINQFIEYMKHCYKNRINTNPAGHLKAEQLTWEKTTEQILKILI